MPNSNCNIFSHPNVHNSPHLFWCSVGALSTQRYPNDLDVYELRNVVTTVVFRPTVQPL